MFSDHLGAGCSPNGTPCCSAVYLHKFVGYYSGTCSFSWFTFVLYSVIRVILKIFYLNFKSYRDI